jgi:hypothetical protein
MGIAVGKSVTISGEIAEQTHGPERAVDGDSWDPESDWHAASFPQWLCIDLEKQEEIDSVQVFTRWANECYQYIVEVSDDGGTWTVVADMSKNEVTASSLGILHKFGPIKGRYVRVTGLGNSVNAGFHLVEVRVFRAR